MAEPTQPARTVYLLMGGEYEDRGVIWATLDRSVAEGIAASDSILEIEEVSLETSVPARTSILTLTATLYRGSLREIRAHAQRWTGNDVPVTVNIDGPTAVSIDWQLSWKYALTVSGADHQQVEDDYERHLGRLKEQTAIPPRERPTSNVDVSLWPRAAELLKKPVAELQSVCVGYDHKKSSAVVVALYKGQDVREAISDEVADSLTGVQCGSDAGRTYPRGHVFTFDPGL